MAKRWLSEADVAQHQKWKAREVANEAAKASIDTRAAPLPMPIATANADATQKPWDAYCLSIGIPQPVREHRFAEPLRQWRFDYCWPDYKIALEVEGGAWTQGRHTRGAGFIEDMSKYNAAVLKGWRVLRVVPDDLYKGFNLVAGLINEPQEAA